METIKLDLDPQPVVTVKFNPHLRRYRIWIENDGEPRWAQAGWDIPDWEVGEYQTRWKWRVDRAAEKLLHKLLTEHLSRDIHWITACT